TPSRHGPDVRPAVFAKRASHVLNALDEGIVRDDDLRPQGADQLLFADEPAVPVDEVGQGVEGFRAEGDRLAVLEQTRPRSVQRVPPEYVESGSARFHAQG